MEYTETSGRAPATWFDGYVDGSRTALSVRDTVAEVAGRPASLRAHSSQQGDMFPQSDATSVVWSPPDGVAAELTMAPRAGQPSCLRRAPACRPAAAAARK